MTNICNFCLKLSNTCSSVDEGFKEIIDLIFINVELVIPESSLICIKCIQMVHSSCDLKAKIICNENLLESYETNKPRSKRLIDVYLKKNKIEYDVSSNDLKICRFCIVVYTNYYLVKDIAVDTNLSEVISTYLPEIVFSVTDNLIICKTCLRKLQDFRMFINSWLDIDNLKKNYCLRNNKTDISDLNEVRKFMLKTNLVPQHSHNCDIDNTYIKQGISTMKMFENRGETNEGNIDCIVDNIQVKGDNEIDIQVNELKYPVEGVQIKTASDSSDVEFRNDVDIDDSKQKTEVMQFEPNMESDDYVLKREEIFIKDVTDDDANAFEKCPEIDLDTPSLCNENQMPKQLNSKKYSSSSNHKVPKDTCKSGTIFSRGFFPKMKRNSLNLTRKSKKQQRTSRNDAYQVIELSDGFRCGLCSFQNQIKAKVKIHFKSHHRSKYSRSILHKIVHEKNSEELTRHQCKHCDFKTKYKNSLKRHSIVHSGECKLYKCEHCDFKTKFKNNFKRHSIKHLNECNPNKCPHCDFKTKYKNSLKRHSIVHSDECKLYKCEHCDFKTKFKNNFKRHSIKHLNECNPNKCPHCDFNTKYKYSLKKHVLMHSYESYRHKCKLCDFKSIDKGSFKAHLIVHSDVCNLYKCEHCVFETKYKGNLKKHLLLMHNDECKLYKCDHCDYKTKYKSSLTRHFKGKCNSNLKNHLTARPNECNLYQCEQCDYKAKYKSYLKKHLIVHSDKCNIYKCERCAYSTKYKYCLKKHLRVHSDDCDLYKCTLCDFRSKHRRSLKTHSVKHSDVCKLYECEHCLYKTKFKDNLKIHSLVHSEECNRYKCEHCDYQTKYKTSLKRHLRTKCKSNLKKHSMERPRECNLFKCKLCDFKSGYKKVLETHYINHDEFYRYKCEHCIFETKYKDNLKKHLIMHSNNVTFTNISIVITKLNTNIATKNT